MLIFCTGEKLSKQQLHNSNIIKKLRAKEKERENINTKQNKKIKELEEELQHLKQVRDKKFGFFGFGVFFVLLCIFFFFWRQSSLLVRL